MKILIQIQQELKAPKGQFNKFGNFRYRSAEDILEAVKPLLGKYNALLTLSDDIIQLGEWIFLKSTARFKAEGEAEETVAFARIPKEKKGMDDSQLTGSACSYARKYALNGLFLIDDVRDPDTPDIDPATPQPPPMMRNPVQTLPGANGSNSAPPPPPSASWTAQNTVPPPPPARAK